jgi:ComEC/Rec2-related protein
VVWGPAAALVAGILQNSLLLAATLFWLLCFVCLRKTPRLHAAFLVLLVVFLYAHGYRAIVPVHRHIAHFEAIAGAREDPLWTEGWVASYPQPGYGGTRFEFVTAIGPTEHRLWVRTSEFTIDYGDSLRVLLALDSTRESKYRSHGYLLGRGLCGTARALPGAVERLSGRRGNRFKRMVIWPVHHRLRCDINKGVGSRAGVPMALLLGERGVLDRRVRKSFVTLGISHLLALSGFHLGFVAGVLVLLLRLARVKRRWPVLVALWGYVALVGCILSLYRALIMVAILLWATAMHRPLRPVAALCGAFLLMLLLYPYALFSVGFQLSFVATLAVLTAVRRLPAAPHRGALRKACYWIGSTVEISAVVQAIIAPVLLVYFGQISLAAPLTTAVFVGPVMVLLALSALAVSFAALSPIAGAWLFEVLQRATVLFESLLALLVRITPAPTEIATPNVYLYYCGFAMVWMSRKRPWLGLIGMAVLTIAWLPAVR